MARHWRWSLLGALAMLLPLCAPAQDFGFDPPPDANNILAPATMRDLAERIVPVYQEADPDIYLTNMAALQLITANYEAADDTAQTLRDRYKNQPDAGHDVDRAILYEIYAHARAIEASEKIPFAQAFQRSFHDVVPQLGNKDAAAVIARLQNPLQEYADAVQQAFDRWRGAEGIPLPDALDLVRKYLAFEAHRSFASLVAPLVAEEDRRRYIPAEDVMIKTAAGAVIHAVVVRPSSKTPLPALLRFTLDPTDNDAKLSAAHDYVGVVAFARGRSSDGQGAVLPFVHDGEDARAVIKWIARQSWCDGRVGLYGDGYSGYAAWAAAARKPAALKAMAVIAPMAPGIDFPMGGRIFRNSALRWISDNTTPVSVYPNEDMKWRALDQIAYSRGQAYRDLDRIFLGRRNDLFQAWLAHPSYDRYWRKLIPSGRQFAQLDIPVLTIAGYYGADAGALHYFEQQLRADPKADHRLLVGPWDAASIGSGLATGLHGYSVAKTAQVDLPELRYQWFDHVLKQAALPAQLQGRVNLQLMGSNDWRHAATFEALAGKPRKFWLDITSPPDTARLLETRSPSAAYLEQSVDLADRSDAYAPLDEAIVSRTLPLKNAIAFSSEPLSQPTEFDGRLSGQLDFAPNRQDVDLRISLYELQRNGDYVQLFAPYAFRASYAEGPGERRLLRAGERQQLRFRSERITSRRLQAGSRLVLVLGINKRPDQQINYGSGKAVAQETLADARPPLRIRWYAGTGIELPQHQ